MADDGHVDGPTAEIPPAWLEPADIRLLRYFRASGPTYHINASRSLGLDISRVSRRCAYLVDHGFLERRSRTYYGITDEGVRLLEDVSPSGVAEPAALGRR